MASSDLRKTFPNRHYPRGTFKALILAGEGPRDGRGIRNSRADSLLSNKTTLLERQVNLLSLFGFSPEEIIVAKSSDQSLGFNEVDSSLPAGP